MGKNWAICVGINEYNFVSQLRFARRDAQEIKLFCELEMQFDKVF